MVFDRASAQVAVPWPTRSSSIEQLVAESADAVALADNDRRTTPGRLPRGRRLARGIVTALLLAAILALGSALCVTVAGYRFMIVRSGSMRPTLVKGDLFVSEAVRPPVVRPHDIVTFRDPALGGEMVTHRVLNVTTDGNMFAFVTKGDANTATEHWSIPRDGTLGREVLIVPRVGTLLAWLRTRGVLLAALLLIASAITTASIRRIWGTPKGPSRAVRAGGSAAVAIVAVLAMHTSNAEAWTITGLNSSNSFATAPSFPSVAGVVLANASGGTVGRLERGDTVTVTFSETLKVSTICTTWSGDASDQTLSGNGDVTVAVIDGTGATNDSISVSSAACTFNFGSIDLGNNNYVSGGDGTFSGNGANKSTITWTAATHTLTITLGHASGTFNVVASSTPTYSVSQGITNPVGARIYNSPYTLPTGPQF
jgi:signal peptidase I